jgi:hypothetical protein
LKRRLPFILAALVRAAARSGSTRAWRPDPRNDYQSADERSYGKLAVDLVDNHGYGSASTKMREPLHWPPGAPVLFAAGTSCSDRGGPQDADIRSAYWEQALITTGTTALAIAARLDRSPGRGRASSRAIVGTYPPLIGATGDQLSEPLGAFLLMAAFVALALALQAKATGWYAAAGALFGLTILTRTDLLPVPFLIAGLGGLIALSGRRWRRADHAAVLLAARRRRARAVDDLRVLRGGAASSRSPGQRGGAVRRHLPAGGGTTIGMKEHLEPQLRAKHPEYSRLKTYKIPAADALELFAAKHPDLPRDVALNQEAKRNLIHYSTTQPVGLREDAVGEGQADVVLLLPRRRRALHLDRDADLAGRARARRRPRAAGGPDPAPRPAARRRAAALAFSTAIHTIVVSQARYNLPLMPC